MEGPASTVPVPWFSLPEWSTAEDLSNDQKPTKPFGIAGGKTTCDRLPRHSGPLASMPHCIASLFVSAPRSPAADSSSVVVNATKGGSQATARQTSCAIVFLGTLITFIAYGKIATGYVQAGGMA